MSSHRSQALTQRSPSPDAARVLTKAAVRAADLLGLNQAQVARVLGVSPATVSRMERGLYLVEPGSKQGELAALLVRLYRSLDAAVGNSDSARKAWMEGDNTAFGMPPRQAIETVDGLAFAVRYLDGARAIT